MRRIYDVDKSWEVPPDDSYQVVHEFDFLLTDDSELYFVIAIFGMEFAINLGGPDIAGYKKWLDAHDGMSPLYSLKNCKSKNI